MKPVVRSEPPFATRPESTYKSGKVVQTNGATSHVAKVDNSGSTCVLISGGSLVCPVDVVPSNWYDTLAYSNGQGDHMRGVMVLNIKNMKRTKNFPFLFNARIEEHDSNRMGAPRMLIRLLKSVKADHEEELSTELALSGFDICSLLYRMPDYYLQANLYHPLDIIRNLLDWMARIAQTPELQASLMAIDDSRLIFDKSEKISALKIIHSDLLAIYSAAVTESGGSKMTTDAHLVAA